MTSRFGEKSSILFCTYKSLKCLLDIQLEMPIGFAGVKVMGKVRNQALGLGLMYLDSIEGHELVIVPGSIQPKQQKAIMKQMLHG